MYIRCDFLSPIPNGYAPLESGYWLYSEMKTEHLWENKNIRARGTDALLSEYYFKEINIKTVFFKFAEHTDVVEPCINCTCKSYECIKD